jgi:hypothetical protein
MVRRVWARWFPTKKQIKLGKKLERERLGVAKYREKIAKLEGEGKFLKRITRDLSN